MALVLGTNKKITVASSAASADRPGSSGVLLLTCNTDCFVRFGGATASSTAYDLFMPAGSAFIVSPGSALGISAIRSTADGILSIQEID